MTRVTLIWTLIAVATFTACWFLFPDVSSLPLCWLVSASLVGMFYVVDRWGFGEIDTIELLYDNPNIYVAYMFLYATLIVVGHVIGMGVVQ